ncbi:hypothetical protein [Variovorax sp. DXTD-1]|uniref:hypothetical protein n=1 Tax=Variovorax sp. DXTD-1 TaxID=2495592 RepID=UPI000F8900F7|nr:hypothetical protein [Variovorax sp. DXTD-1]RST54060.1 hypothetical protein EJI00_02745 [Variovorax sp. DXTD-1]
MGQANGRRAKFFAEHPMCIFCGGAAPAETEEHCPPRSLFKDRAWPEGFVFPACVACNAGSSDADLVAAFLAQLRHNSDVVSSRSEGIMRQLHRQHPGLIGRMLIRSPIEARARARRLGIEPRPGETHLDLGLVKVTAEMEHAVSVLASKLTKAVFYVHTGRIFPAVGSINLHWFTNAELLDPAHRQSVAATAGLATLRPPVTRGGKDLRDQFDYSYGVDTKEELLLLHVGFGDTFGFVSLAGCVPGQLDEMSERIDARLLKETGAIPRSPFKRLTADLGQGGTAQSASSSNSVEESHAHWEFPTSEAHTRPPI